MKDKGKYGGGMKAVGKPTDKPKSGGMKMGGKKGSKGSSKGKC